MIRLPQRMALVLCIGGVAPLWSCGGDKPANPTPPTTTATAPVPSPTPTATPAAGGGVLPKSCANPPVGGSTCGTRPDPQLKAVLAQALDDVRAQGDIFYPDGATVRYLDKARAKLIAALDARGICGVFDFGDGAGSELYVQSSDGNFNEVYAVLSSSGQLRAGYLHSCEPPEPFPQIDPGYRQRDSQCSLPPSGQTFCLGRNFESAYATDVRSSLVSLTAERPELFDLTDSLNCDLCYRLIDPKAYLDALIGKLHAKGYCAIEDEELLVKKDNSVSENFDVVRSPGDRPYQYSLFAYKGRCHNAEF